MNKENTVKMQNNLGKIVEVKLGFCPITLVLGLLFAPLSAIPDLFNGSVKTPMLFLFIISFGGMLLALVGFDTIPIFLFFLLSILVYSALRSKWLVQFYLNKGYKFIEGNKEKVDNILGYTTNDKIWYY